MVQIGLWIAAAQIRSRRNDEQESITSYRHDGPVGKSRRRRTQTSLIANAKCRELLALKTGVSLDDLDEALLHGSLIFGAASCTPLFAYSTIAALKPEMRGQVDYWQAEGVSAERLWFFEVSSVEALPREQEFHVKDLCVRRTNASGCFTQLTEAAAILLTTIIQGNWPGSLCVRLPLPIAMAIIEESLATFAVPCPFLGNYSRWLKEEIGMLRAHFMSTVPPASSRTHPFALAEASELADDLRCLYHDGTLPFTSEQKECLHKWIHSLELFNTSLGPRVFVTKHRINAEQILQLALVSNSLRSCENMGKVILAACRAILPKQISDYIQEVIDNEIILPNDHDMSLIRLRVDVALMLFWRCTNSTHSQQRVAYTRSLAWDSSPQYGRDYENAIVRMVQGLLGTTFS